MNWEYLIVSVKSGMLDSDDPYTAGAAGSSVGRDNLQAALNQLGSQGWEACSTTFDGKGIATQVMLKKQK